MVEVVVRLPPDLSYHPVRPVVRVIRKIGRKAYDDLHHRSLAPVHANDHYWVTRLAELEERAG